MPTLTLTPAYGRDYKSQQAVRDDWYADKDFRISDVSSEWNGSVINREDAASNYISEVSIRYNKLTKVCIIKATETS